jgi:hypothetical protein
VVARSIPAVFDAGSGPALTRAAPSRAPAAGGESDRALGQLELVQLGAGTSDVSPAGGGVRRSPRRSRRGLHPGGPRYCEPHREVDGSGWSTLGADGQLSPGIGRVGDSGGPKLYAGGPSQRQRNLAIAPRAGTGASWLPRRGTGLASALSPSSTSSGPLIHAGGDFGCGRRAASRIATRDSAAWEGQAGRTRQRRRALAVFDDGSGPALCASREHERAS